MKKNRKKYAYFLWALYVPVYLIAFFTVEKANSFGSPYRVSYLPIDDRIPFVAWFILFYYLWFPSLVIVGLKLLVEDGDKFRRYMWFIATGFSLSVLVFCLLPSGQDLRPYELVSEAERVCRTEFVDYGEIKDNLFTRLVSRIYAVDTNTNVFPSVHVIGAFAVQFGLLDSEWGRKRIVRWMGWVLLIFVNLSTVFCKQHSVLDVLGGVAFSVLLYVVYYGIVKRRMEIRKGEKSR